MKFMSCLPHNTHTYKLEENELIMCWGLNGCALTFWPDVLGVMDRYLDDDSQRRDAHVVAKSSRSVTIQKSSGTHQSKI